MSKNKLKFPLSIHTLNLNFSIPHSFNIENRLFVTIPIHIDDSPSLDKIHINALEICFERNSSYSKYKCPLIIFNEKNFYIDKKNFQKNYQTIADADYDESNELIENKYTKEHGFFPDKKTLVKSYEEFFNHYLNNHNNNIIFSKFITTAYIKHYKITDKLTDEQQEHLNNIKEKELKELQEFTQQVKEFSINIFQNFNNIFLYHKENKIQIQGDIFKKNQKEDKIIFELLENLSIEWQYCELDNITPIDKSTQITKKSLKL